MRIRTALVILCTVGPGPAATSCSPDDGGSDSDVPRPDGDADAPRDDADSPDDAVETIDTWGMDFDGDGFSPATGDCDDSERNVNPSAFEAAGNLVDDDCDGTTDVVAGDCDCDAPSLAQGIDLCDPRFLLSAEEAFEAPNGSLAAGVRTRYGDAGNDLGVRKGCAYSIVATAPVDLEDGLDGVRQPGTDFYFDGLFNECETTATETDPSPTGPDGTLICDSHQLVLHLRAPANANGFSFDFVYLTTEYPEWVDQGYNDTFYAIIDRPSVGEHLNISFDESDHEIEVDNAFFEDPPTTDISGTGYDGMCDNEDFTRTVCGSSTGWLRTSWNIEPNEEFTLTFSIHDEGDGIYDSASIIDSFTWSLNPVEPGTIPL